MEWVSCKDKLPETPEKYIDAKHYLVCFSGGYITTVRWWNGWNCRPKINGETDREHEMTDVIAWAELPDPYKKQTITIEVEHEGANIELAKKAHEKMILCRECKYQFITNACPLIGAVYDLSDYDFCSYGERKNYE